MSRMYGGVAFACARFARQVALRLHRRVPHARGDRAGRDWVAGRDRRAARGGDANGMVVVVVHADMESTVPMSSARHLAGVASREASPPVV